MSEKKKVVIVGGGFAGVKTALELSNNKHFDVTLITPRSRFEYHGAMYRSATGKSPLEVVVPMSEIFAESLNVQVELDTVAELRPQTNEIEGESGRVYSYNYLVMAVGYVVNYFDIPGMALYSETLYSITEAIKLRHRLVGAFRNEKDSNIEITVIGAGPTGIEVASDIENFGRVVSGKHGLRNLPLKVRLLEASDRVLGIMSKKSSRIAQKRLEELNVELHLNTKVTKCTKTAVHTDKKNFTSDVTIWTAGNKANPLFSNYPDLFSLDQRQRVLVSEYFNANSPNVFVIGDAASTPYSGMAQTAIHNAIALSTNLKYAAEGKHQVPYKPKKPNYAIPIGGEWALLETEKGITYGRSGWDARREADLWVLENFLVYNLANKHWLQGDKLADF